MSMDQHKKPFFFEHFFSKKDTWTWHTKTKLFSMEIYGLNLEPIKNFEKWEKFQFLYANFQFYKISWIRGSIKNQ